MRKNEEIEALLKSSAFIKNDNSDEWNRDQWTIRFFENEMEIYENINSNGKGRYLLTEKDVEDLKDILNELN